MTFGRITAGINKAEDAGRMDAQIMSAKVLQPVFPTAVVRVYRMSWLDSPRDLVQRNIGNIDLSQPLALGNGFIEVMRRQD